MTHLEVPDVGSFPSVFVHAALKHHSVCVEFESETEVKDIKINHRNICHWPSWCFPLFPVFWRICDIECDTKKQKGKVVYWQWEKSKSFGLPTFKKLLKTCILV